MSDSYVKFSLNISTGELELEGPEEYVTKTVADMKPMLSELMNKTKSQPSFSPSSESKSAVNRTEPNHENQPQGTSSPETDNTPVQRAGGQPDIQNYPHTFEVLEGDLHIVADIPGESDRAKMTNVALLYAFGSQMIGKDTVTFEEIRQSCKNHGCLDAGNFSKAFKDKRKFILNGARNKTVKLTHVGRKAAQELAESFESDPS
ncbi:hypothetical protein [Marinobacter sp. F3R08]|uniref:hypothetical protein n=1 Tax=Marinobacter sp. F3R08 TaxID=2841559 RepID=UPI001C098E93|nr:hypothetical protein [Marinobacter sp. F3R08]MBU2954029.1 hypothetical protein [Marinobacter sp. F3R08]